MGDAISPLVNGVPLTDEHHPAAERDHGDLRPTPTLEAALTPIKSGE